ncbi:MAG TPA: hypothetical protein VGK97_01620 [Spongiibacteraceae bacterium]
MSDSTISAPPINPLNALGRFIFLLSLIVAAIAAYYFFLIERGSEHVYRRDLRSLAQIERQINSGFDRVVQVASTQTFNGGDRKIPVPKKNQQIGGRTYELEHIPGDSNAMFNTSSECASQSDDLLASAAPAMLFKIISHGSNVLLDFCVKSSNNAGYVVVRHVPLADFVSASEALEQFHQILVFDSSRNLIFSSGGDANELSPGNVYDLLAQNATTHESLVGLPDSWLRSDDDKKTDKATKQTAKSSTEENGNANSGTIPFSKVQELAIGEQKYLAFIRPFKLDYSGLNHPNEAPTWYVVGITTKAEFNASRFMIPRWWVAVMVLALTLLLLGTPYLKLRLLGPRDLIRSSTIALTIVALLFAAMITTIMLLNLSAYALTEQTIHNQLRVSSQLLAGAFETELNEKKAALATFISAGPAQKNPPLIRASVFDADGNLSAFWSAGDTLKPGSFSVRNRNFWQQLERFSAFPLDKSDLAYSLDNILNRIDGKKITVLAQRVTEPSSSLAKHAGWIPIGECKSSDSNLPCNKAFSVVTGLFNFNVFNRSLLPKGYGFIVIDNASGTVQYHAEAGADLIEHLYEETDNNPALKTAINTGSPDTFQTNYRGHSYLFHTRPLAYSHWTLITYFSQELLDSVNLGLLLAATGLSGGFLLLYLIVGIVGFKFLSRSKINLLWPNPTQTNGYRLLLGLLIALCVALITAISSLRADQLFSVLAMAPLAALSGAYICLIKRYQPFQSIGIDSISVDSIGIEHGQSSRLKNIGWQIVVLLVPAAFIVYALLCANSNWPWQLIPQRHGIEKFIAHGSGVFIALMIGTAAFLILALPPIANLINATKTEKAWANCDWRRALLHTLFIICGITLVWNLPLFVAMTTAVAMLAVMTQPLWARSSAAIDKHWRELYMPLDRRSDRSHVYALHRLCVTLIIVIVVMLPAVAFYRDATSLYILRWSQQDAQKLRSQLEYLITKPETGTDQTTCGTDCKLTAILDENKKNGLIGDFPPSDAVHKFNDGNFTAAPALQWQPGPVLLDVNASAEERFMRPVREISSSMAYIAGFSKEENDTQDDLQFSAWQITRDRNGQHMLGALKLNHSDYWLKLYWPHYFDFGLLSQYRLWILLGLAAFAALAIYPMVRLVLRELVAEADLRPHPVLTAAELDLLIHICRSTLLLVSSHSIDKSCTAIADVENEVVKELKKNLVQNTASSPTIDTLPYDLNDCQHAADIMVVAEKRWQTIAETEGLDNKIQTQPRLSAPTWQELLHGINKLRYPDDVADLAMDYWQLDRTCTLLICPNIEAQKTLAAYATKYGWQAQLPGTAGVGEKIWLQNIESILFEPHLRKNLLSILENLQTHESARSLVLTSLILPHLWFTEKGQWREEEFSAREQTRWLAVLTRINVRTVTPLTIEQHIGEINRSRHALPRAAREAEYALWWQYSTAGERMALAALTHEGLINPYNRSVIRSLMARGLIFRGSTLHFCDKGFKLFVKYKFPVTLLRRQANVELQHSSWGAARGPLLITLALLGYGVMVMGGGAFETILGLATSIGASIPALLNLARLIKRDGGA